MEDVAVLKHNNIQENVSLWEDDVNSLAPLLEKERDTIIEIAQFANCRLLPSVADKMNLVSNVLKSYDNGEFPKSELTEDDYVSSVLSSTNQESSRVKHIEVINVLNGRQQLESCQEFLLWYASLEDDMEVQENSIYKTYISQLISHQKECQSLLSQLNVSLSYLHDLSTRYTTVSNRTSALHTDCEHLLSEQTCMTNRADMIESKLSYFREIDKISKRLNSPLFRVTSDDFIPLLAKIDECINYINSNSEFLESSIYLARYRLCLSKALGMVKSYVTKSLENATKLVKPNAETLTSDNAAVLYYGKFRTNAHRIKTLMAEIEDRVDNSPEYQSLLNDCYQCYFIQRQLLIGPCVTDAIAQFVQKYHRDYCSLVRSGCAFLVHICEDEHLLFHQFFTTPTNELDKFLQSLCTELYDILRPLIIHIEHLETLSELCNILKRGMIEEHIQNNPHQLAPLTTIVNQMLEDTQERLVYRSYVYIQSDIANFNPSSGDLAYPSKLIMMESIAENIAVQQRLHSRSSSVSSVKSATSEEVAQLTGGTERISHLGSSPADLHGMWYPTVRRTLMCLSKLYRCVERSIFQGVSLEALSACMHSLTSAAAVIKTNSSALDAHLFEIKHLLILREQLAPFQVDVSLRETSLDWSKLKEAAFGLVHKRNRLFSLTSNNALLEFIFEGAPHVTEHILDSRRDLDNRLKKVCEQMIFSCVEMLVGALSAFLAKADVILQLNKEENVKPIALKHQPFATPEKVSDVVQTTLKTIKSKLPTIFRSLQIYLANRETEYIIFKPIRSNALSVFFKLQDILVENYNDDERIIVACPTQEELTALFASLYKR